MEKSLQNKAIDFKGKPYVQVSDRVLYFNETYPEGSITTKILSGLTDEVVVVMAIVFPDCKNQNRVFIGHSQAKWGDGFVNKTSALENAETSAVGRALAMMGIGVIESIASLDEVNKANSSSGYTPKTWSNSEPKSNVASENGKVVQSSYERIGKPVEWDGSIWQRVKGIGKNSGNPYDAYFDQEENKKDKRDPIDTTIMESNLKEQEKNNEEVVVDDEMDRAISKE